MTQLKHTMKLRKPGLLKARLNRKEACWDISETRANRWIGLAKVWCSGGYLEDNEAKAYADLFVEAPTMQAKIEELEAENDKFVDRIEELKDENERLEDQVSDLTDQVNELNDRDIEQKDRIIELENEVNHDTQ